VNPQLIIAVLCVLSGLLMLDKYSVGEFWVSQPLVSASLWDLQPGMAFVFSARSRKKAVIRSPQSTFNTNPYLASFLTGVLVREQNKEGIEWVSSLLMESWFVFIPCFAISLVFALLRISPLFNLLVNLLVVVVLGIIL